MAALHNSPNRQIKFASVAMERFAETAFERLEYALAPIVVAVGTKVVRRLHSAHFFLERVSKLPAPRILQYIPILLSFPVFELSNLGFQLVFVLQQRRLIVLGRQTALLGGHDYSLEFDNLRIDGRNILRSSDRIKYLASSFEAGKSPGNSCNIKHGRTSFTVGSNLSMVNRAGRADKAARPMEGTNG